MANRRDTPYMGALNRRDMKREPSRAKFDRIYAKMHEKVGSPGGTGTQYDMPKDHEVSDHSKPRDQK
jgi:hypothetical protein